MKKYITVADKEEELTEQDYNDEVVGFLTKSLNNSYSLVYFE